MVRSAVAEADYRPTENEPFMARAVAKAGEAGGVLVRPWFGARLQEITTDIADSLAIDPPHGVASAAEQRRAYKPSYFNTEEWAFQLGDSDEGRLFGWSGVLTIGGLALDLFECRF